MRFAIEIGDETVEVEATRLGPSRFSVRIGQGAPRMIEGDLGAGLVHLIDGERSWAVKLGARGEATHTHVAGRDLTVQVQDERRRKQRAAEAAAATSGSGRRSVRSPMPGKVVKVLVEVGQTVHAGQGVVIVEAMKMEHAIRAPAGGRVTEFFYRPGELVAGGAQLLSFEPTQ